MKRLFVNMNYADFQFCGLNYVDGNWCSIEKNK